MTINSPKERHLPALRALWKEAFKDTDDFLDLFFGRAYSPERCLVAVEDGDPIAALYWLDCSLGKRRLAYIYAVATARAHRGKGVCSALMSAVHRRLGELGYHSAILVPAESSLYEFYSRLGYTVCSSVVEEKIKIEDSATPGAREAELSSISASASSRSAPTRKVGAEARTISSSHAGAEAKERSIALTLIRAEEYAKLRRKLAPAVSVIQEGASLDFLAGQVRFCKGDGFILAARAEDGRLFIPELLGNVSSSAVVSALARVFDADSGKPVTVATVRTPAISESKCSSVAIRPFAMSLPLQGEPLPPCYLGFAFD